LIPGPSAPLAAAASITLVTINQGVEIPLTIQGIPTERRNAPVITGRPGLVRIYVDAPSAVELTAELWIVSPGAAPRKFEDTKTLSGPGSAADLATTLDVALPADAIRSGSSFRLYLTSRGSSGAAGSRAQLPRGEGTIPLQALDTGTLPVRLVPFAYTADGSNRIPELTAARVSKMRDALLRMMPLANVAIDVHAPVPYAETVTVDTFDRLLAFVTQLRSDEHAPRSTYYYGVVLPTAAKGAFCNAGCTQGQGNLAHTATSVGEKAAVGTGYDLDDENVIFVHEMGHALGSSHAPCGMAAGPDSRFPYAGGHIGTWGYDTLTHTLVDPSTTFDVMSYCTPVWISDFDYALLGERLAVDSVLATEP
jgi:hypothetical protein